MPIPGSKGQEGESKAESPEVEAGCSLWINEKERLSSFDSFDAHCVPATVASFEPELVARGRPGNPFQFPMDHGHGGFGDPFQADWQHVLCSLDFSTMLG